MKRWFSSGSGASDPLTWNHHDTLCIWIPILAYFLAWLFETCVIFWVWWSVHGGCEWSTKNRSLFIKGENILCDLIGWWLRKSLARAGMNGRKSFYCLSTKSSSLDWDIYIWIDIWAWHDSIPIACLGYYVIEELNCMVTRHRRIILIFLSNFVF